MRITRCPVAHIPHGYGKDRCLPRGFPDVRTVRELLRCHWASRRLQRYLDADPTAALSDAEVTRLQSHLAECRICQESASEYRSLARLLSRLRPLTAPDPDTVARVRAQATRATDEGRP
ncbi:MAG: zf-HC2 domain-containing protein [Actinomycetales bacterium]|nr:zf-HC2 domain-containing protein [Actinomycetales bacterium]